MLDQNDNFSQISLSILITCLMDNVYGYFRGKLHIDHLWELKSQCIFDHL